MIIAGTGHRPDKLGGYSLEAAASLASFAKEHLLELKPDLVISGMALGWDQALADAAIHLGIPTHAYVPFVGQEDRWPQHSKAIYYALMHCMDKVVYCSEDGYAVWKMQKRNEDMVKACDTVVALWDGSAGGTGNCISYANKMGKPIINLYESWKLNRPTVR